ncbi:hypothetical protein WEI85_02260 [Actinomycetes bacterium KLBMP 9797]
MGALITLDLPGDVPARELPWVITFGPLEDDLGWEPVVCGPYERAHAVALAESIAAEEDLLAVIEPMLPYTTVDEIRREIAAARLAAEQSDEDHEHPDDRGDYEQEYVEPSEPPTPDEVRAGQSRLAIRLTTQIWS